MLAVRRWLLALGFCAAIGCGLDAVGGLDGAPASGGDAGPDAMAMLPDLDASGDAAGDASAPEAGIDAALDAEATRPDAGVTFVPSHIYPDYTLTAAAVVIGADTLVDTTAGTISIDKATPVPLTAMVHSGAVSVWSVGSLTVNDGFALEVVGSRPLVIVSASTVLIDGRIDVYGDRKRPGPGGAAPSSGSGKGGNGTKPANDTGSGGGGAGHATAGTTGATQGGAAGGFAGAITNTDGALFIGGGGGGNGGGFGAAACTDPTRGKGGFGGGALQISAVGKITISGTGYIDAGGGAGLGGCKNNPPDDVVTGGGGGGAGGLVFLESVAGIDLQIGSEIAAGGGGGGEGGSTSDPGKDGESGLAHPAVVANGGTGSGGGAGGNGGYGVLGAAAAPSAAFPGGPGAAAGGGGGAVGQVFLGVRVSSTRTVNGSIAALRSDVPF